jgi:hypothetical protein
MTTASRCPDEEDLQRFTLGEVSERELLALERHLEQCSGCAAALQTLHVDDTLSAALRAQALPQAEPGPPVDDVRIEAMMRRLEALRRPVCDSATQATVGSGGIESSWPEIAASGDAATPAKITAAVHALLAPARGAGELGWLGPYRIVGVLGSGGMGVVFRAEDPQLKRQVAVKALLPKQIPDASARRRFLREAQAAAAVEHDHIIHINQVGEDRGVPFVAMPLLHGESLEDRLRRVAPLPVREVLRIGREIGEGLAAAHARGLIHRDIKPANIWLQGDRGRVKILDFGLARPLDPAGELSQVGAIIGTPTYMAPEQAQGGVVDQRTDLFSLGCVMYRMATGEPAARGANTIQILMALTYKQPLPPRQLNAALPPALEALLLRLLAKEPEGRPPTVQAVVDNLRALESNGATDARTRPGACPARGRGRRWLRVAVAVVLLAGLALAALWFGSTLYRSVYAPDPVEEHREAPEWPPVPVPHKIGGHTIT